MNDPIKKVLFSFLQHYYKTDKPILLALSGGPDSLVLFHLLLNYQKNHPFSFGIAHVNHNWRPEATTEALALEELAGRFGIPFHLKSLLPGLLRGNLEAASRDERLKFFCDLCNSHHYQAVLLGHHADDQAETVLKRIFEGADLAYLAGLKEIAQVQEVTLWRPLLKISKVHILEWVKKHELMPFRDSTNLDSRFLRGKMRSQIIPELANLFGKEISGSLCHLGHQVQEMRDYFSSHLQDYLKGIQKGPFGCLLDLSQERPSSTFEIKFLIREWCLQEGFCLSRELMDTIHALVMTGKANKRVSMGGRTMHVDRGRLFLTHPVEELSLLQPLVEGKYSYGPWQVEVKYIASPCLAKTGWQNVWAGHVEGVFPAGTYHLGPACMNASYQGGTTPISKWWNNHKVPAFLRNQVPVILKGENIQHEFLSSRSFLKDKTSALMHVVLTRYV